MALVAAVILLLLPFTAIYELALRGACEASAAQARRYQADAAVTVHSLVKNAAYALLNEVTKITAQGQKPGRWPERCSH